MADNAPRASVPFKGIEAIFLIIGFVCVSIVFIAFVWFLQGSKASSSIALPMLSIAGIALLLICLAAISYVFVRVDLQDRSQALGLPPGSIQAVIALSLIVLFAILSILVFTSTGDPEPRVLKVTDTVQRDALVGQLGTNFLGWETGAGGTYMVYARNSGTDARNDIGKQLVVLIGTLMTSAVSFYFGTRATVAGADLKPPPADPADAPPAGAATVEAVLPAEGIARGAPATVTINGTGLAAATAVAVTKDGTNLPVADVTAAATSVTCTVTPPQDAAAGAYDVSVTVAGRTITRAGALTVA